MKIGVYIPNYRLLNGTGTFLKMLFLMSKHSTEEYKFFSIMPENKFELVEDWNDSDIVIENHKNIDEVKDLDVIVNLDAFGRYSASKEIKELAKSIPVITVIHSYWYNTVPERLAEVSELSSAFWIFRDTYYKYTAKQYDFEGKPVFLLKTFHPAKPYKSAPMKKRELCIMGRQLSNTGEDKIKLTSLMKSMGINEVDIYGTPNMETENFFGFKLNYKGTYKQDEAVSVIQHYKYSLYDRPLNRLGQQFEWTLQEILIAGVIPVMPIEFAEDMMKQDVESGYYDKSFAIVNLPTHVNNAKAKSLYTDVNNSILTFEKVLQTVKKL